jgi:hypothetical protein
MRFILLGLAALALSSAPAFAQQIHPGAQRFAHTVLVETGMFDQAMETVRQQFGPMLRDGYTKAPWAANLDPDKRAKVAAYIETVPDLLFAAMREELPNIETAVAIAYSKEMTSAEADQIADYFGSGDGLAFFKAVTGIALSAYASGGRRPSSADILASLTPQQIASVEAFSRTPGGRAFSRVGGEKARTIMRDAIAKDVMPKRTPELRLKLRNDVCAIVGEPCPVPMP